MKTYLKSYVALVCCIFASTYLFSQNFDTFADGDFTASPAWTGDTGSWIVTTDSDVAAGATGSNTLRLNHPTGAGTQHISAQSSLWGSDQSWAFFFGRRAQALTAANSVEIWLYATEADLESATNDGYRLTIGDNAGLGDEFILEEVTNGTGTTILSSAEITNGLTDFGVAVSITRDPTNLWTLKTSVLPTANGTGMTADQDPIALATVTQGTGTEGTYVFTSTTGYFGVVAIHSLGANGRSAVELDQITLTDNGTGLTQFWNEDFGTGCSTGTQANGFVSANGTWTVTNTGTNETLSNVWYVSAEENGVGAGNCGTGCGGANSRTLHISSNPGLLGDIGAAYYVSGAAGLCGFGICAETNKRVESPLIDCSGQTNIVLDFDYIENGQGSIDNAELWYYDGISWSLLADMAKTGFCGLQGLWTAYSVNLPSSADDNSGVKIGFRWTNNDDGIGTDPSIAVDNLSLSGVISDPTEVEFASDSGTVSEDGGTYDIALTIENESFGSATSVDVVLISGNAADLGNYTTQTVTFPANSSADELLTITLTDNTLCTNDNVYVFELQNISGGNSAFIAVQDQFTLTVDDDEYNYDVLFEDDFEDADISDWNQSSGSLWEAGQTPFGSPITGSYSLAHVDNAFGAGEHYISNNYSDVCLDGVESTWRFQANYSGEPSQNNYFLVYLTNNGDFGNENGYAIGVFPQITGDLDRVKLWKMTNGAIADTIINSGVSWTTNGTANPVIDPEAGFEIKRSSTGEWSLKLDIDGGFDNLVSYGTPSVNTDYAFTENIEVLHRFTSSLIDALMVDDISFTQEGCSDTYYSQSSGNVSGAIWSTMPSGTAGNAQFGRYTNMVIQSGHTVVFDENVTLDDLTIDAGGILDADLSFVCIDGDLDNSGTFDAGTSNISFNGNDHGQTISSTNKLVFYNLSADNGHPDGVDLTCSADIINALYPNQGDFDISSTEDLVLVSTLSNTGGIAAIADGATVTGEITLERSIDAGNQAHICISTPILNLTIADIDEDIITTGFPGSDYPSYSLNNFFTYDPIIPDWVYATADTDPLENGKGYFYLSTFPAQFFDLKGTFGNGDISVAASGIGSAYNIIGNPYPCAIDWDKVYAESVNISPTMLIYDSDNYTFLTYNAMTQSGTANNVIESSQGFVVIGLTGDGTVEFREDHKVIDGIDVFERVTNLQNVITFTLSDEEYSDESLIGFRNDASMDLDPLYDVQKVSPFIFDDEIPYAPHFVSTLTSGGEKLKDNVISSENLQDISINITAFESGTYDLKISPPMELNGLCLSLEDLLTGETYSINGETTISFETEITDEVRFILYMNRPFSSAVNQITCSGLDDGSIVLESDIIQSYTWYNEVDEVILSETTDNGSSIENLSFGNYVVVISNEDSSCGLLESTFYIHQADDNNIDLNMEYVACDSEGLGEIMITNESENIIFYELNTVEGELLQSASAAGDFILEVEAGEYTLEVSGSCMDQSYTLDLRDPNRVEVSISDSQTVNLNGEESVEVTLDAAITNAESVIWFVDGEEISTTDELTFEVNQEGEYNVLLKGIQGNCEDEDQLELLVVDVVSVEEFGQDIFDYQLLENELILNWETIFTADLNLNLIDLSGKLVKQDKIETGLTSARMDLSALSQGIYILSISDENNSMFVLKLNKR